jgi:SRSO17 transposase
MDKADLKRLRPELDRFLDEFVDCFAQRRTMRHLRVYVGGQLGPLQRKSVEPIALEAGVPPRTLQEFFSIHNWSAEDMKRRVRQIVAREPGDTGGIGILDDTGCLKKGDKTAGVQRQYCGSVGKVDNCVVSVHLGYATKDLHALIDSDLYLPEEWLGNPDRRKSAGIPEGTPFRTKWQIALAMIDRAKADGIALKWITADAAYGDVPGFLQGLVDRDLLYVVDVRSSTPGRTPRGLAKGTRLRPVSGLWPKGGGPKWKTYRVKDTHKGPLVWTVRATRFHPSWDPSQELWLIEAKSVLTGEVKYCLSNAPADTPLETLLTVAFSRWRVERLFEDAKQEVGFDHFEMRKFSAVQRHFAISMVSLLFLQRAGRSRGATDPIANDLAAQKRAGDSARFDALRMGARSEARPPRSADRVPAEIGGTSQTLTRKGGTSTPAARGHRPAYRSSLSPVDLAFDVAL